jgi:hypothetical protein
MLINDGLFVVNKENVMANQNVLYSKGVFLCPNETVQCYQTLRWEAGSRVAAYRIENRSWPTPILLLEVETLDEIFNLM